MSRVSNTNQISLLVVDDDPDVLTYIDGILPEDYTLFFARNGREAMNMLEEQHFGIVVADVHMPEMDGISLCRNIRNNDYPDYVYLLLASTSAAEEDVAAGIRAGADDYLYKPFNQIELLAKLHIASRNLALHSDLQQTRKTLVDQSLYDPLTHVYNRRHLLKQLHHDVHRAERYGHSLSVVLCNIDHMSEINAQHGHNVGDAVLQQLAQSLQERVRENIDSVARIGGDEFALLLPETKTQHAMTVAQRIREAIDHARFAALGESIKLTVRLGVAGVDRVDSDKHSPDTLISHGKYFLDQGKKCGGNTTAGVDISSE